MIRNAQGLVLFPVTDRPIFDINNISNRPDDALLELESGKCESVLEHLDNVEVQAYLKDWDDYVGNTPFLSTLELFKRDNIRRKNTSESPIWVCVESNYGLTLKQLAECVLSHY